MSELQHLIDHVRGHDPETLARELTASKARLDQAEAHLHATARALADLAEQFAVGIVHMVHAAGTSSNASYEAWAEGAEQVVETVQGIAGRAAKLADETGERR
jgi:hypothetical protein